MEITQEWEVKLVEEARKITEHGFGKIELQASESKELKIKVVIWAGKSYIYFIKRIIDLNRKGII